MSESDGEPLADVPATLNIPLIMLGGQGFGVGMRIDRFPTGEKMLVLGPMVLGVPLSPESEKWLTDNLSGSGVLVVPASAMPNGPLGGSI